MPIRLERVALSDERYISLCESCLRELRDTYTPTKRALQARAVESSSLELFALIQENKIVAAVSVKRDRTSLHLSALYVSCSHRGRGLARLLLSQVSAAFSGAKEMSVWCVEETGNVDVFRALGFSLVRKEKSAFLALTDGRPATEVQLSRMLD
ncbi:GNAT family N-acetyltransferase [Ferrimonas marina]|uniref:Acetyltransferase (GNAT) domain-containing protein n=1 Tax=Ferrimonas marina TaxID=299255 RepID=A0A1M5YSJ3_9GAMM|nr:Acetyltransferase (GNAT) domain-containing protein [Ferrimonas marina]